MKEKSFNNTPLPPLYITCSSPKSPIGYEILLFSLGINVIFDNEYCVWVGTGVGVGEGVGAGVGTGVGFGLGEGSGDCEGKGEGAGVCVFSGGVDTAGLR
jgi:hypothetical protein